MIDRNIWLGGAAVFVAALSLPTLAGAQTALTGATLVDGNGRVVEDSVIIVDKDRIACAGAKAECRVPKGAKVTSLSGKYVTPGLIDAHVHFDQTGWLDGRPDALLVPDIYSYPDVITATRADSGRWHRAFLCAGVTAVYDVGGAPWTVQDSHATDTDRADRAHVRSAGPLVTHMLFNGPGLELSPDQQNFFSMKSDAEALESVRRIKAMGSTSLKVWFIDPKPEERDAMVGRLMLVGREAKALGMDLIVHATEVDNAKEALRAGATYLVHNVDDKFVDDEFIALMKKNDATLSPTIVVVPGWSKAMMSVATGWKMPVDDPGKCVSQTMMDRINNPAILTPAYDAKFTRQQTFARAFRSAKWEVMGMLNLKTLVDAGVKIATGTDAGNPLTMHGPSIYAEMEAMQDAGMTPMQVIESTTVRGAEVMRMSDTIGTLEKGKIADLLVLGEDPRKDVKAFRSLTHVMRKGVLKTQEEL